MLNRIDNLIRGFENFLAFLFIFSIIAIVTGQVIFRFLLSSPLSWSQELATFLLIWITLLGMAIATREKAHIAVNLLKNWVPAIEPVLRWVPWCAMGLLYVIFGTGGLEIALVHISQISPVTGVPMWMVFAAFPVASVFGLWHLLFEMPELLRNRKVGAK